MITVDNKKGLSKKRAGSGSSTSTTRVRIDYVSRIKIAEHWVRPTRSQIWCIERIHRSNRFRRNATMSISAGQRAVLFRSNSPRVRARMA